MEELLSNQPGRFVDHIFSQYGLNCGVKIASAFFSNIERVRLLVRQGCTVQLIVRLGHGTDPVALKQCVELPRASIRYYTDSSFHPKFYIFGGGCALVGSANLTNAGLTTNSEVALTLPSEDPRFEELQTLFDQMWAQAQVFEAAEADRYMNAMSREIQQNAIPPAVKTALGSHRFANIQHAGQRQDPIGEFAAAYKRTYQRFLNAQRETQEVYENLGVRLEAQVPLRFELDELFNFIRDHGGAEGGYLRAPILGTAEDRTARITAAIQDFRASDLSSPW